MYFLNTLTIAIFFSFPLDISFSMSFFNSLRTSATITFKAVIGPATLPLEPTALNSNLLPVKAKGEVLFLSVLSNMISGILLIPNFKYILSPFSSFRFPFFSNSSNIADKVDPRKMEIMAGGASLAPRRWSLPAEAILALSKSAWTYTALMVATKKQRNCRFSLAELLGWNRLTPVSVINDQLLCFPLPFNPANGFS